MIIGKQQVPATATLPAGPVGGEYWEQRLTRWDGLEGVGYTGLGLAFNEWQYFLRRKVFLRNLRKLDLPLQTAVVLDVGSGTGFWMATWRSLRVKSVTGLDITSVATENLRAVFPDARVVRLDIASPDVPAVLADQFDIVSAFDMLYHIAADADFSSAIANIASVLKTGGAFVFTENMVHQESARYPNQVNRTIGAISAELQRQGLRIIARAPMFVIMNKPVDTKSHLPSRLWNAFMSPVRHFPWLGRIYGPLLFPAELFLTAVLREGPSTELVFCRKEVPPAAGSSLHRDR